MKVLGIIMSTDSPNDLRELTEDRTVAAVPFGGRYRIVDFMLSNMVNSGINTVGMVMTRKYQSLIDHLGTGKDWDLSRKVGGLILLPPYSYQQKISYLATSHYRGKIDSLVNILHFLANQKSEYVMLSDADIVMNIDLNAVMESHFDKEADITAVCINDCIESPYNIYFDVDDSSYISDISVRYSDDMKCAYTSLGVYFMKTEFLRKLIEDCAAHNISSFEHEALPMMRSKVKMHGYVFDKFAVKINNIKGFYESNIKLINKNVRDELFLRDRPIYTRIQDEAPVYYGDVSRISEALIADGAKIEGEVHNSIIFRGVHIGKNSVVKNSIVMENTIISNECSISYIISDKHVNIREARVMMGHENYPVVISKNAVV